MEVYPIDPTHGLAPAGLEQGFGHLRHLLRRSRVSRARSRLALPDLTPDTLASEDVMVDNASEALLEGIRQALAADGSQRNLVEDGHGAAVAIVELMDRTATKVAPSKLVYTHLSTGGGKSRRVTDALWKSFGDANADNRADGAATLAMLWDSTW